MTFRTSLSFFFFSFENLCKVLFPFTFLLFLILFLLDHLLFLSATEVHLISPLKCLIFVFEKIYLFFVRLALTFALFPNNRNSYFLKTRITIIYPITCQNEFTFLRLIFFPIFEFQNYFEDIADEIPGCKVIKGSAPKFLKRISLINIYLSF